MRYRLWLLRKHRERVHWRESPKPFGPRGPKNSPFSHPKPGNLAFPALGSWIIRKWPTRAQSKACIMRFALSARSTKPILLKCASVCSLSEIPPIFARSLPLEQPRMAAGVRRCWRWTRLPSESWLAMNAYFEPTDTQLLISARNFARAMTGTSGA